MRKLAIISPVVWFSLGLKLHDLEIGILASLMSAIGAISMFFLALRWRADSSDKFALAGGALSPIIVQVVLLALYRPEPFECIDPCVIYFGPEGVEEGEIE